MHILITAGGTREYIDPVRYITNASSGRMGYSLARAAVKAGHSVTLITTVQEMATPASVELVQVETAAEMFEAVKEHFETSDCLIMSAAVADYTPAEPQDRKLKKSDQQITITLKPTIDIAEWAGGHKAPQQKVIGFALEDSDLQSRAQEKLERKNLDMIVANDTTSLGAEKSRVHIKSRCGKWRTIGPLRKATVAEKIIRSVQMLATEGAL